MRVLGFALVAVLCGDFFVLGTSYAVELAPKCIDMPGQEEFARKLDDFRAEPSPDREARQKLLIALSGWLSSRPILDGNLICLDEAMQLGLDPNEIIGQKKSKGLGDVSIAHLLVLNKDLPGLKRVFEKHAYVGEANAIGETPLDLAITSRFNEGIEFLINKSHSFSGREPNALKLAALHGTLAVVKKLVDAMKPEPSPQPEVLEHAARNAGRHAPRLIEYLIDQGFEVNPLEPGTQFLSNDAPLLAAIRLNRKENAKALLARGAYLEIKTSAGVSPAERALMEGDEGTLLIILEAYPELFQSRSKHGCRVYFKHLESNRALLAFPEKVPLGNVADPQVRLWLGIELRKADLLKEALAQGADVLLPDELGFRPVHCFAAKGNWSKEVRGLVFKDKAAVEVRSPTGSTAFLIAAQNADIPAMEELIARGADVTARDNDGNTALHVFDFGAGASRALKIVSTLLSAGLRVQDRNNSGTDVLHAAVAHYAGTEVLKTLLAKGAAIDGQDSQLRTPLHLTVISHRPDSAKLMLESGADPLVKDASGRLPQHYLSEKEAELSLLLSAASKRAGEARAKRWLLDPKAQDCIRQARTRRVKVRAECLDFEDAPLAYYRAILNALKKTNAGLWQPTLHPTAVQARRLLRAVLSDREATNDDFENLGWFLGNAHIELDEQMLRSFDDRSQDDAEALHLVLSSQPLKYKDSPVIAGVKLAKALLAYPEEDYACEPDSSGAPQMRNRRIKDMLNWLVNSVDAVKSERLFFAKIVRYLLKKRHLCELDESWVLKAMAKWSRLTGTAQYELAWAMLERKPVSLADRSAFTELLVLNSTIGNSSELSFSGFVAQLIAFGEMRGNNQRSFDRLGAAERALHDGLLRYVLGNDAGTVRVSSSLIDLRIPASASKPGEVVKLCRIMKSKFSSETSVSDASQDEWRFVQGSSLWFQDVREQLDKKRRWPEGFQGKSAVEYTSLREEFRAKAMDKDLEAIEQNCSNIDLPISPRKFEATPRPPVSRKQLSAKKPRRESLKRKVFDQPLDR